MKFIIGYLKVGLFLSIGFYLVFGIGFCSELSRADASFHILFLGDSLTAGYGVPKRSNLSQFDQKNVFIRRAKLISL